MADTIQITGTVDTSDIKGSVTTYESMTIPTELDPVFTASPANDITEADITKLANLSGTNSGDETGDSIKSKLGISTLSGSNTGDKLCYALQANCGAIGTPTTNTTYWYGSAGSAPVANGVDRFRVYVPKSGRIKTVIVSLWSNSASSGEAWPFYIRINNTTDYLIASVGDTAKNKVWSNTGLDIAVNAGDYFEIKFITPAWVTVPTTLIFNTVIYLEA